MTGPTHAIDLDAYFRRIGYDGPREPTLSVLRDLTRLHTLAIPFENLDPLLGRPLGLDAASLEAKLVRARRGGYCFEHNPLLQHVLKALGFEARALAARVQFRQPDDVLRPRTHVLLRVEAEGESYLADVGFGGQTPTGPLLLRAGLEQATPHESYRIDQAGPEYELRARIGDAWTLLYRFHLVEHFAIDHEVNNHYVATYPTSFFRSSIVAARPNAEGRHLLFDDRLAFQRIDGTREERALPDAEALIEALDGVFGIDVSDRAALAAVFASVAAS